MPSATELSLPESYFAPAGRASETELRREFEFISRNPIIDALMQLVGGVLAVLNVQRQIVAVNQALLDLLDIDREVLGLRPGEALDCIHAHDHPGGCGTSRACATCGAAIAILACQTSDQPTQKECFITANRAGQAVDYYFQVRCSPVVLEARRFYLLFLLDTTVSQKHAALGHAFFHDVGNLISSLALSVNMLNKCPDDLALHQQTQRVKRIIEQLTREVQLQRMLCSDGLSDYQVFFQTAALKDVLDHIQEILADHTACKGKTLRFPAVSPHLVLDTDVNLLQRILANMVINALEATPAGGEVRLWLESDDSGTVFCVWNRQAIPEIYVPRIFQRNFSTKQAAGRGMGTYIMKLLGETYLRGVVDFTTSEDEGTIFRLHLPGRVLADR